MKFAGISAILIKYIFISRRGYKIMLSMTGYGKGEFKDGGIELTVEIKSVNNRYLDVAIKAPKIFVSYEEVIRSRVRESITRGHLDVFINFTDKREKERGLCVDLTRASSYIRASEEIKREFPSLADDVTVSSVLRYNDVLKESEAEDPDEEVLNALNTALSSALNKLNSMRLTEGEKLKADMLSRMVEIEKLVGEIKERAPLVAENYKVKLKARMERYLSDVPVDEGRLLNEVAAFSDKCNIDEELTRLNSHILQFRSISESGIVGRKLDFLVQEFNREANTICSKSNDLSITGFGLSLKNEIEKVREQVQNIE